MYFDTPPSISYTCFISKSKWKGWPKTLHCQRLLRSHGVLRSSVLALYILYYTAVFCAVWTEASLFRVGGVERQGDRARSVLSAALSRHGDELKLSTGLTAVYVQTSARSKKPFVSIQSIRTNSIFCFAFFSPVLHVANWVGLFRLFSFSACLPVTADAA